MKLNDDERAVATGYDLVYEALPRSPLFTAIWREHALGADYPAGFEHISFLSLAEMRWMLGELQLVQGETLVDLACGMGGPGLWIAREAAAHLSGIDISPMAIQAAGSRAKALGMAPVSRFATGSFAETGLQPGVAAGVMSVDAVQYAPDKREALREAARVLQPGGRLVFACFEVEPDRVRGLPVFGTDPVADYRPILEEAKFAVTSYEESAGWRERMSATYTAVIAGKNALAAELGEAAMQALAGEMALTLQLQPYSRRVLVSAHLA